MNIQQNDYPVAISKQLVTIIGQEIEATNVDTSDGVILNFRDPDYNAESGGYRLFSSYQITETTKIWVITEADRSVTTLLLPQDY